MLPQIEKAYRFASSTELAVGLFLVIAAVSIPGTFLEQGNIYTSVWFLSILGLFALNLLLCTVRRWKGISPGVMVLHLGILVTLCGCIGRSFGYVATVNVYEGTSVSEAFRWDVEKDLPIGVDLTVRKINREYYPVPVQVGVMRGGVKGELLTLKTGDRFQVEDYTVRLDSLEIPGEILKMTVFRQGQEVGTCDSTGAGNLPPGFPFSFKLVAFRNPVLKRLWVDLALARNSQNIAEGVAEVNNPLRWGGLYFFNTQVERSPNGLEYAGIQIVRDPGRPLVFAGFVIIGIGSILAFTRRFNRKGAWN